MTEPGVEGKRELTLEEVRRKLSITIGGVHGPQSDLEEKRTKILIYGHTGVGKTRLAATAALVPKWQPCLYIDTEFGATSLQSQDYGENLHLVQIEATNRFEELRRGIVGGKLPYRSVVIDGAPELYRLRMTGVIARSGGSILDLDSPEIQHWGQSTQFMRRVIRDYLYHTPQLECVVVTAAAVLAKDETTGAMVVSPDLPGKLAYEFPRLFDLVMHMSVKVDPEDRKKLVRVANLQPTPRIRAKDRWDLFDPLVEEPNLAEMWAARKAQLAKLREQRSQEEGGE